MREGGVAGIDVAFAKGKPLPIVVCRTRGDVVEPLPLRRAKATPPRGRGNALALQPEVRRAFAEETAAYLHAVEEEFELRIERIAIDAPSDPKQSGSARRACEREMDRRNISCITTPDAEQFDSIRARGEAHLASGGSHARLPGANQIWMLVGFALFERLRREWECLEVFPQAIARALRASDVHKRKAEGQLAQLTAAANYTHWPSPVSLAALDDIAHGARHDRLDAYLAAWIASLPESQREPAGLPPNDVIWLPAGI
jgi:hypothetical protein